MGRGTDRMYQRASEWRDEGGGHKGRLQSAAAPPPFSRLPFHCCAISFTPFEDPVCAPDGTVFDIVHIVPYIQKFHRHPVSGAPLGLKDLTKLHFHRNADGEFACPVLGKVFNAHTHIVAIKTTGNVYCWDAIQELCLKPKNFHDLLTEQPFARKDIVHIQDPNNVTATKSVAEFDHVKHGRSLLDEAEEKAKREDPMFGLRNIDEGTRKTLAALGNAEAAAAAAAGGGGKKAQAERALALAHAAAKHQQEGLGGGDMQHTIDDTKGKPTSLGKKPDAEGSDATRQLPSHDTQKPPKADPRLRSAPRTHPMHTVNFKPGASTWSTDTLEQQQQIKSALAAAGRGGNSSGVDAKDDLEQRAGGRRIPSPYSHTWLESSGTTGASAVSLTSTAMAVTTKAERSRVLQQLRPEKKGYARIHTSLGDLNLELHCDVAPRTCENWLALAEAGYYDDTPFHRLIKHFMVQGGDPTGTGTGGCSIWGPTFADEFDARLSHDGRGVVSMANAGPNTNGSQFFITFKSARHLDRKHTIFGKIVGGFETLTALERLPTDDEDHPLQPVAITSITIFVNPYKDVLEDEKKREAAAAAAAKKRKGASATPAAGKDRHQQQQASDLFSDRATDANLASDDVEGFGDEDHGAWFSDPGKTAAAAGGGAGGVGKYLQLPGTSKSAALAGHGDQPPAKKKSKGSASKPPGAFVNFDAW